MSDDRQQLLRMRIESNTDRLNRVTGEVEEVKQQLGEDRTELFTMLTGIHKGALLKIKTKTYRFMYAKDFMGETEAHLYGRCDLGKRFAINATYIGKTSEVKVVK